MDNTIEMRHESISRWSTICAVIINAAIVVMEIIATIMTSETHGIGMFKYYTIESNIFAGISSAIFVVVAILHLTKGHSIPKWVKGLRYMATCCLTVTIAVVLFAAMPMEPRENAFEIWMTYREAIFQHLICPIVSFISFVFFEKEPKMRRKYILVGFSPTVAYGVGVVGLTLNQDIEALYTFAAVSTQPVMVSIFWGVAIMGAALLICYITWKINSMKFPGDVDPQEFAELEETAELNDSTN